MNASPLPAGMILVLACAASALIGCARGRAASEDDPMPAHLNVGRAASPADIAAVDIDVGPDGAGLPPGKGTAAQGIAIYTAKCASCHGANGEGVAAAGAPQLIGREPRDGFPFGRDDRYPRTIGNYWPYATTVFDYVHRAMPLNAPGSLTADETYALTAFLLARNEIIQAGMVMDAKTLAGVKMPARDRFVPDDRTGGRGFR